MPICWRCVRSSFPEKSARDLPRISTRPEVGTSRKFIHRTRVLFPAPDIPMIPKISPDSMERLMFFNAFSLMKYKTFHMNRNSMKLMSVKTKRLREIEETEIIVKMQSSLVARKHNSDDNTDIYYTCDDPEFPEIVKENLRIFLQKVNIERNINDFSITPVKGKKVVARIMERYVDTSIGIYKITGHPRLLELLYAAGIGTRRSEGHGKFEIIY